MSVSRRLFLGHLFAACAAPAIVRAGSLMPVKALDPILFSRNPWWTSHLVLGDECSDELIAAARKAFLPSLQVQIYKSTPLMRELALRALQDPMDLP
jgi:hypothetical protein